MKKILIALVSIAFCLESFSQKITIDKDTIRVDGKAYCLLKEVASEPGFDNFMVQSLDGKDLILIKKDEYTNPNEKDSKGKPLTTLFYVWTFIGINKFCDTPYYLRDKKIATLIYEGLLIKDGQVDPVALDRFILINGTTNTDNKKAIMGPGVILIKD